MTEQGNLKKTNTNGARKRKGGGSAARRAARAKLPIIFKPTLVREIPVHELLDSEGVALIHETAMTILEEIGIGFNDEEALALWKEAGADVTETLVRIPRELIMSLIEKAPSEFTLHARNPERNLRVGGRNMVFHPQGGAYITGFDGVRRRVVKADLSTFVKLTHCLPAIQVSTGWPPFDLSDVPVPLRHLEQLYCPFRYSDKPICANLYSKEAAEDAVAMCQIVFGKDFVDNNTVTTALANANTPLKWDATQLEGAKVLIRAGQAVIFSPFVMYGASVPPHQLGATAQVVAESLSGVAFAQLLRPGVPALFGNSPLGVSMKSGAPSTGVPEVMHQIYLTGQMARYYKLPWRNTGPMSGAKVVDYFAGHDAALRAHASILAGANWLTHCCGALESGMHLSFAKLVLDAELMDGCFVFAKGLNYSDLETVKEMMQNIGDEGHFLGADYTRENLAFIPHLQDNETHETWVLNGSKTAYDRGLEAARNLLDRYEDVEPTLDRGVDDGLREFVTKREAAYAKRS